MKAKRKKVAWPKFHNAITSQTVIFKLTSDKATNLQITFKCGTKMTPAPCNLCKCVGSHLWGNRREVLPSINANVVLVPPGPCVRGISGFWQHDFACFFNYFFIFHPFFSAFID